MQSVEREARPGSLPEDISGFAIFLDVDGTLVDLVDDPAAIVVEPWMAGALRRISDETGGALALITGRSIAAVDRLFSISGLAVSGLHGAERRGASGVLTGAAATPEFDSAKAAASRWATTGPGLIFEDKGPAFALHYRRVPHMEGAVRGYMAELGRSVGERWVAQEGKHVVELRPSGLNKGDALKSFMEHAPFAGRRPLAIGDDVTDEAMFAAANALHGVTVRVGANERPTLAAQEVASPADVRAWLRRIAE